ncbi:MAG: septum formation initiator family protein [Rothia sp. (in: high G+C Gram-positive bacteria)]|nr:septum formation initiator family protein [Rothia sp. (in: high G+C Gram-positive bacteria)]
MARTPGQKPNPIAAFFGFGLGKPASAPSEKKRAKTSRRGPAQSLRAKTASTAPSEGAATPVAAHAFSGHFITFAIVLVIIALSVYTPLTSFIRQQNEINDAKANIAALQTEQESLKAQVSWWQDDNYVKQQARSRLFYVEPGETPYLVVGLDSSSDLADDTSAAAKTAPEDSWTTKFWGSLQLAAEDTSVTSPAAEPQSTDSVSPSPTSTSSPISTSSPTSTEPLTTPTRP